MISESTILLIEDDQDINEAIELVLKEEGLKVKCTFNGQEALDYLKSVSVKPGLILLDIMMPQMNGYEFRQAQLKNASLAEIPTVVLSAAGKYEDIDQLHFKECLKKPIDLDTLIEVVKRNVH